MGSQHDLAQTTYRHGLQWVSGRDSPGTLSQEIPRGLVDRLDVFRNSSQTRTRAAIRFVLAGCLLSAWAGVVYSAESVSDSPRAPRVLVLYSQRRELPICEQWGRGIRDGLESGLGKQVVIDSEYLDFDRLRNVEERQALLDLVLAKYLTIEPDVIIPVQDGIAGLFVRHNPFPDAAVVFCSILEVTRQQLPPSPKMTGVVYRFDAMRTVQQALELFPSTHTAIVASGSGEADLLLLESIRRELTPRANLRYEYWTGDPLDTVMERVSRLPQGHVIIFNNYLFDSERGIDTVPRDVLERIAAASNVPVFALWDTLLGTGIVGGCMPLVEEQGRMAGDIAARILNGESPADIPFSGQDMNRFVFDWNQLRRWKIDEQKLPIGSVVLFRQESFWAVNRTILIAGGTALALQSLLIAALLLQRRKRTRMEVALSASRAETERLPGRILSAIEGERKRIARELHDDISQRLAAGAMEVGRLEQEFSSTASSQVTVGTLKEYLVDLAEDVHRMSRQLHPSILKDLGLSEALRAECNRAAERGQFTIKFHCGELPASLGQDLDICVYRIVQEALNNVVKHARTERVSVTLNADVEFLDLEVRDFGCGFKPNEDRRGQGLGLQSMRERVRLINGQLTITSVLEQGTCVHVSIPLRESGDAPPLNDSI